MTYFPLISIIKIIYLFIFRKEGNSESDNVKREENSTDAFHDDILDWFNKQEKGKKTTLV